MAMTQSMDNNQINYLDRSNNSVTIKNTSNPVYGKYRTSDLD